MKKFIQSRSMWEIMMVSLLAFFATVSVVMATTTIGTNMTTEGTLSVTGLSTLLGGATTTSITLLNGETIDNTANGYISLMGIASTTSIYLANGETIANSTDGTINITGKVAITGSRISALTGYENFLDVSGDTSATAAGAKTYAINVDLNRPATSVLTGGDLDDAGIKVRVGNRAANLVAGPVLRGIDVQARNRSTGTITNVYGGLISTQTDSGSSASTSKALDLSMTINGTVEGELTGLDLRMFRQAATEPTTERAMRIRNGNTSGTGIDAGLVFESENPGNVLTKFNYIIDMDSADVTTAEIRLTNGETIDNAENGVISLTGIASTTSIRLANLETITNGTNGTIILSNDGGATISFTPATGVITPSTGMLYVNASSTVMGYATTTSAGIIIPTAVSAAPATCGALYEGGLAYDSTKKVLCICIGTAWLQATSSAGTTCF